MNFALECTYCGHKWTKALYSKHTVVAEKCPKCRDSKIKVKDLSVAKVDYYEGSPSFPPKTQEDAGWLGAFDGLTMEADKINFFRMPPDSILKCVSFAEIGKRVS
jgi:hypothetical protein